MDNLVFEYVIVNPAGQFYRGNYCLEKYNPKDWSKSKQEAFRYTAIGADRKITSNPSAFAGCTVKKDI